MIAVKDEKRLFILNSIIYALSVLIIYLLISDGYKFLSTLITIPLYPKLILRSCLMAFAPSFLLIILINNFIWRWRLFRQIAGIKIPCIHGRWEGYLLSTYTQHKIKHRIVIEFWQTMNDIRVWYYDENAITHSLIADFAIETEGGPTRIYCVYVNQPIRTHDKGLQPHHGVMELIVDDESRDISGIYYNNPFQRATYGEIYLKFKGRKLSKQFNFPLTVNSHPSNISRPEKYKKLR